MFIRIPNCEEPDGKYEKLIQVHDVRQVRVYRTGKNNPKGDVCQLDLTVDHGSYRREYSVYGKDAASLYAVLSQCIITNQPAEDAMSKLFDGAVINGHVPEGQVYLVSGENVAKVDISQSTGTLVVYYLQLTAGQRLRLNALLQNPPDDLDGHTGRLLEQLFNVTKADATDGWDMRHGTPVLNMSREQALVLYRYLVAYESNDAEETAFRNDLVRNLQEQGLTVDSLKPEHPLPKMNTPVELPMQGSEAAANVRNRAGGDIAAHEEELAERLGHPVAGTYRHFKGLVYEVHGLARNSTNLHKDNLYQVVYSDADGGLLYVRDEDEFFGETALGEQRFKRIGEKV